jgi:replicative DNA helicase
MSNLEYRILTKILKEGTLHPALVAGLKEDYFEDIESRQIWRFFNQHWYNQNTFRTIPTLESIQRKWPSFQPTGEGREALTALIEDLRSRSLDLDAKRIAAEFEELVTFDTSCDAIRKMRDKINELLSKAEKSEEYTIKDVVKYAKEHYANAKSGAVYGIPWPWDCLTHDTLGKRKGNLIVFYARMKSMKCVCAGQKIMTPSGLLEPIEKLDEVTWVPSYTASNGKIRVAKARRVVSGVKECVEVKTESGLKLRTSEDHLYMTPGGKYKRIRHLKPGNYVATSRRLPDWTVTKTLSCDYAFWFGRNHQYKQDVLRCLFSSDRYTIAQYLLGLMDVDASMSERRAVWVMPHEELAYDIQHFLMRFGVRGYIENGKNEFRVVVRQCCQLGGLVRYITDTPWVKAEREFLLSLMDLVSLQSSDPSSEKDRGPDDDIIWERIESITSIGEVPCYDICIEDGQDPNFVVEGFIVHNTWLTLHCAVHDYMVNNCRVLIWSREMSKEDLCLRVASLMARVDYQLFKKGRLPPRKEKEMFDVLQTLLDQEDDLDGKEMREGASKGRRHMLLLAGRNVPKDTASLQVVIDKYQPSIVYLDSFYHMDPTGASNKMQRWERLAKLSEIIKAMAQDNDIPFVAVHQANRLGEKTHGNTLADLADTDVLGREADLIMRILKRRGKELYEDEYEVVKDNPEPVAPSPRVFRKKGPEIVLESRAPTTEDDAPRVGAELAIVLGGNREGVLEALTVHAVPGYNFSLISSDYSTQEISQWLKEDEEPKPLKAAPRPEKEADGKFNKNAFRQYLKSN